jgi:hypothetical protein
MQLPSSLRTLQASHRPIDPSIRPSGFIARGTDGTIVIEDTTGLVLSTLALASVSASAYHGFKRNGDSLGYGALWGGAAAVFPVITPAVAVAQGFGERAKK